MLKPTQLKVFFPDLRSNDYWWENVSYDIENYLYLGWWVHIKTWHYMFYSYDFFLFILKLSM